FETIGTKRHGSSRAGVATDINRDAVCSRKKVGDSKTLVDDREYSPRVLVAGEGDSSLAERFLGCFVEYSSVKSHQRERLGIRRRAVLRLQRLGKHVDWKQLGTLQRDIVHVAIPNEDCRHCDSRPNRFYYSVNSRRHPAKLESSIGVESAWDS